MTTRKRKDLTGIVLIGGKSQRMGKDKSLIAYHGKPQYQYLHHLLTHFCEEVYLSCNKSQAENFDSSYQLITDLNDNQGPLEGIKSAFIKISKPLLLVPCDMPDISRTSLNSLIEARDLNHDVICFQDHDGYINPLFAIWENSCIAKLKHFDGDSPNQFLKMVKAKILKMDSGELKNINTPSELNNYFKNQG